MENDETSNSSIDTADEAGVDLVVIDDEFGTALLGTDEAIEEFANNLDALMAPVRPASGTALSQLKNQAFGKRSVSSAYMVGVQAHELFARPKSGAVITYHRMVRDASSRKILSNARIPNPGAVAGPQMAALAALEVAISAQFDALQEHLDVIEDKVDEILRLASAERIGDVYGHYRLLTQRVGELAKGHALTATDWSSIAHLGVDLEVGVERLRVHALKQLESIDPQAGPGRRGEQLESMLRKGRLVETLRLLLVAQKSLLLWQKLRLEQVRTSESHHLDQTISSARSTLREQYEADTDLLRKLRGVIEVYTVLRPSEAHHKLAARNLTKRREELKQMLDEFMRVRNLQLAEWGIAEHATIAEALAAARERAGRLVLASRQQIARGAAGVASWIEPGSPTSDNRPEESEKGATTDSADEPR